MWTEHGWEHVTAEVFAKKYPGGKESRPQCVCWLCGQVVRFSKGSSKVRPHFKHRDEKDKSCPDRVSRDSANITLNHECRDLPLRIIVSENSFTLWLGFIYIPPDIFDTRQHHTIKIVISNNIAARSFKRLHGGITYINVGNQPSNDYLVDVSEGLGKFCPNRESKVSFSSISGVDFKRGSVFDKITGIKVPLYGDVQPGRKYYILTRKRIAHNADVLTRKILYSGGWLIYEAEAQRLSRGAAEFFMKFGCRLTDSPLEINMIWPVHAEIPYAFIYSGDYAVFHIKGMRDIHVRISPGTRKPDYYCGGHVMKIFPDERHQQMIYAGTFRVIKYIYLWRKELQRRTSPPYVEVRDGEDRIIEPGEHSQLPGSKSITVTGEFDGHVITRIDGRITDRYELRSGGNFTLPDVCYGLHVSVLQGLDEVFSASFRKDEDSDGELLSRLCSFRGNLVPLPGFTASVYGKLSGFPKVREWILRSARRGSIPERSLKLLKKYIIGME